MPTGHYLRVVIVPDPILPVQYHPGRQRTPEQHLLLAILEGAIVDLSGHGRVHSGVTWDRAHPQWSCARSERIRGYHQARLAYEANLWFLSEASDWPCSFVNICAVLGLEVSAVRKRLQVEPMAEPQMRRGRRKWEARGPAPR